MALSDNKGDPVRSAIDSTVMLVLARFLMPAVIAITGYLMTTALEDLKSANRQMWVQLDRVNSGQALAVATVSGLTNKVDGIAKQVDHLQTQVDGLPKHP